MLNGIIYCYAACHYAECHYAECHYAECRYAECHYAECCGAAETTSSHPYASCFAVKRLTV
jgi:hypothetical protein